MDEPEEKLYSMSMAAAWVEVEEKDCFIIRVKQSHRNVTGEKDALIHKQEAVCRMCYQLLGEVDDVLKAKCECYQYNLVHTKCSRLCGSCQQIMHTVPVNLLDPRQKKHHESVSQRPNMLP